MNSSKGYSPNTFLHLSTYSSGIELVLKLCKPYNNILSSAILMHFLFDLLLNKHEQRLRGCMVILVTNG